MNIHTFELFTPISMSDYQQFAGFLFSIARYRRNCTYKRYDTIHCNFWSAEGIVLSLKSTPYGGTIHVKINPCEMLGNYNKLSTFTPNEENTSRLIIMLDKIFRTFPILVDVHELMLFRVDLCKDTLMSESACMEYIRLLRKRQVPQNWERPRYNNEDDRHIYRAKNERFQVTAYDKLYQIEKFNKITDPQIGGKVLRLEVAILRDGLNHLYKRIENQITSGLVWTKQLCLLSEIGVDLMIKRLNKISFQAPYLSLAEAKDTIKNSSYSSARKERLIDFLTGINRYKTVDIAQIRARKNGNNRLTQLSNLAINPITIKARAGINILPSPQQLIQMEGLSQYLCRLQTAVQN